MSNAIITRLGVELFADMRDLDKAIKGAVPRAKTALRELDGVLKGVEKSTNVATSATKAAANALSDGQKNTLKAAQAFQNMDSAIKGAERESKRFSSALKEQMQTESHLASGKGAQAIRGFDNSLREAEKNSKKFSSALKDQMQTESHLASGKGAQAVRGFDSSLRQAEKGSKQFASALKEQMQSEQAAARALEESDKQRRRSELGLARYALAVEKAAKKERDAANKQQGPGGTRFGRFMSSAPAQSMARDAQIGGVAVLATLAASVKVAAEFEEAMRNVNSIAKLSEPEFEKLGIAVRQISKDPEIRKGPRDLAKAMYEVVSSGFKGAGALDVLKESARGATAGMTSTAIAGSGLMAVLNSGIPGVKNSKEAMNALFRMVDIGKMNFEQLAGSIGAVLPLAAKAGVTLQEVGAVLSVATISGQSTADAVNDLQNLLTKIIRPSDKAAKMMREMGISYGITALQAKGLTGILDEIIKKTKGKQDVLAQLFPDMQAFRGLLQVMAESGKKYSLALAQMSTANEGVGATTKSLQERAKSTTAQWEKLKTELEDLALSASNGLLPVLKGLLSGLTNLVTAFSAIGADRLEAVVKWTAIAGGLSIVGGAVVRLVGFVNDLKLAWIAAGTAAGASSAVQGGAAAKITGGALVGNLLKGPVGNLLKGPGGLLVGNLLKSRLGLLLAGAGAGYLAYDWMSGPGGDKLDKSFKSGQNAWTDNFLGSLDLGGPQLPGARRANRGAFVPGSTGFDLSELGFGKPGSGGAKPTGGANIVELTNVAKTRLTELNRVLESLGIKGSITSGKRSNPKIRSAHNRGEAVDLTTGGNMVAVAKTLNALGFRATFENKGQRNANGSVATGDHVHIDLLKQALGVDTGPPIFGFDPGGGKSKKGRSVSSARANEMGIAAIGGVAAGGSKLGTSIIRVQTAALREKLKVLENIHDLEMRALEATDSTGAKVRKLLDQHKKDSLFNPKLAQQVFEGGMKELQKDLTDKLKGVEDKAFEGLIDKARKGEQWRAWFKSVGDAIRQATATEEFDRQAIAEANRVYGQHDNSMDPVFASEGMKEQIEQQAKNELRGDPTWTPEDVREAKKSAKRFSFDVGREMGSNLAAEMGSEFSSAFDKVFGSSNPIARALNRTLSRLLDATLEHVMTSGFAGLGLDKLLGGKGIAEGSNPLKNGMMDQSQWGDLGQVFGQAAVGVMIAGLVNNVAGFKGSAAKGSMIGGALGGALGGPLGGIAGSLAGGLIGGLFRADGGPVTAGRPYITGERGPELFVPHSSGRIVPNYALAGAGSGPAAFNQTIHIHGNISHEADEKRLARKAAREVQEALWAGA